MNQSINFINDLPVKESAYQRSLLSNKLLKMMMVKRDGV